MTARLEPGLVAAQALWTAVLLFGVPAVLRALHLFRPNFRGKSIPSAYGLFVVAWLVPPLIEWWRQSENPRIAAAYLLCVCGYGGLGFLDDKWGDRKYSGLRGHVRALVQEHVFTTGLLKAAGGIALGLSCAWLVERGGITDVLVGGGIVALTSNALNLLDLRPGRAGAVFLAASLVLIFTAAILPIGLALAMIPAAIAYFQDARAKVMLGDTGSNLLGGILGLSVALAVTSMPGRIVVICLLIAFHIAAEKVSLTQVIERNPVLRRLDGLTGQR